MERRVLFLQPDRLTCYRIERDSVVAEQHWKTDRNRLPEDLRPWLNRIRQTEFNLLIDLPEEECHLESFKAVSRRDQRHLVAKMQNKRFENALVSKASVKGSSSNVSVLLSGVAEHKICAELIGQLEQAGVCVRAVHSPLTLMSAVTRLSHSGSGACLFFIPLQGCYRLVACVNSFVFFSRRIVVQCKSANVEPGADQAEKNDALKSALTETLVYLQRQQIEGWKTPELVVPDELLAANRLKEVINPLVESGLASGIKGYQSGVVLRAETNREPVRMPIQMVEANSHSNWSIGQCSVEAMLASAACRCGNGYATRAHRSAYTTRKVRNICAALALCGLGGAVSSASLARKITGQHETLAATYSLSATSLLSTVAGDEAGYEHSVEAVRQAMVTAKLIELGSMYTPIEFLNDLAENVNKVSGVSVNSVHWEMEDFINDTSLTEMLDQPVDAKALNVEQVYQATVTGVVHGNPGAALTAFESFVSTLRGANADPSVVVVETPFGLGNQDKTTMSSLSDASGQFVLELSTTRLAQ